MKRKYFIGVLLSAIVIVTAASIFIFRGFIITKIIESRYLRAGKPIKFGDYTIIVDKIEGKKLFGIKIDDKERSLEAKSGEYEYNPAQKLIIFNLFDGSALNFDPQNPEMSQKLTFKQFRIKVKLDAF